MNFETQTEAICQHCGKAYMRHRVTSKFCSDSCRVKHHRKKEQNLINPKNQAIDAIHKIGGLIEGELSFEAVQALKTISKIALWQSSSNAGSWWRCQKCWQAVRKELPLDGDCSCGKCEDADWRLQKTMI